MRVKKTKKRGKVRVTVTPLASGMCQLLQEIIYDDGSEEEALLLGPMTTEQAGLFLENSYRGEGASPWKISTVRKH